MNFGLKKLKVSKASIFYLAWILMIIHLCVANSNASEYSFPMISYFSMALFGIKILIQKKKSLWEYLEIIGLCIIGILSFKASDDMRVLWFVIVMCACKNIDFDKAVKYSFYTILLCCLFFMILHFAGVLADTTLFSIRGARRSFGLGHPNMFAAYYVLLMIQYVYLKFNKLKARELILFIAGSIMVYNFTKSVTGFVTAVASLIIFFVLKFFPLKKINSKAIVIGLICGIILFTAIPIIYSSKFAIMDALMTGRLHQANFYYEKYGINLIGNNLNADLTSIYTDNILDIGYARMLINNGLIYYIAVVYGYVVSMFRACELERRDLIALMSCFIVHMLSENFATYIFMNVSMLLFRIHPSKNKGEM